MNNLFKNSRYSNEIQLSNLNCSAYIIDIITVALQELNKFIFNMGNSKEIPEYQKKFFEKQKFYQVSDELFFS